MNEGLPSQGQDQVSGADDGVITSAPPPAVLDTLPSIETPRAFLRRCLDEIGPITLNELEGIAIRAALRRCHGSVGIAARSLGIGRATLYRRLSELEDEAVT